MHRFSLCEDSSAYLHRIETSRIHSHHATLDLAPPPFSIGGRTSSHPRLPAREVYKADTKRLSLSQFLDCARGVGRSTLRSTRQAGTGNSSTADIHPTSTSEVASYYFRPDKTDSAYQRRDNHQDCRPSPRTDPTCTDFRRDSRPRLSRHRYPTEFFEIIHRSLSPLATRSHVPHGC